MKKNYNLIRVIVASVILIVCIVLEYTLPETINGYKTNDIVILPLTLSAYLFLSYDLFIAAFRHLKQKQFFDEIVLTLIATIAAFCIQQYVEALAVLTFFKIGTYIEDLGYKQSQNSMKSIIEMRPDSVTLFKDNVETVVDPYDVEVGDYFIVKPGERIPLDGIVRSGNSSLDTSSMTGESLPKTVREGDTVISGVININSPIVIEATTAFYSSTLNRVLEMVENATNTKTREEKFITKFSKIYTPTVVALAFLVAIIPPLCINYSDFAIWSDWIYKGASFLVVSCPCSLVISVPMAYFVGIGKASKYKALIKGSIYIEKLNKLEGIVLDKTGTITKGNFEVANFKNFTDLDVLKYAAIGEYYSNHPIAVAIKKKNTETFYIEDIQNYTEVQGQGISLNYQNKLLLVGNSRLFSENKQKIVESEDVGTKIYVSYDNVYLGFIVIKDIIKETSKEAISNFYKNGIKNVYMLTGDNEVIAKSIADECNINNCYSNLLPIDKANILDKILAEKDKNKTIAFVGDGVNDALSLKKADLGISMGAIGSEAAIEASDIVLMNDDLNTINKITKLSKTIISVVYENIVLSLLVKILVLVLTTAGVLGTYAMWFAIFGDVGVTLIAVLNSLRIMLKKV